MLKMMLTLMKLPAPTIRMRRETMKAAEHEKAIPRWADRRSLMMTMVMVVMVVMVVIDDINDGEKEDDNDDDDENA